MPDREKVIIGLEFTKGMITFNPLTGEEIEPENLNEEDKTTYDACVGAIVLLKEQEEKTGHWIYKKFDDMFMCSCCEKYSIRNDYPYCHWCGAKMEGREGNESA